MQIVNKIDELIKNLNDLRPTISDDNDIIEKKFTELLKFSMDKVAKEQIDFYNSPSKENTESAHLIPTWVNPDYNYDPENPRKPNMRELMEAISGKSVEELYAEPGEKWKTISRDASEALYGVVGSNKDTRDWHLIMTADDILMAAKEETGKMYAPVIDIVSHFDNESKLIGQTAVVKDKGGDILRSLSDDISNTEETLKNFGVTNKSIPDDIEARVDSRLFNKDLLNLLTAFDQNKNSTEKLVFQTATDAISNKLSTEIPLEELEKL